MGRGPPEQAKARKNSRTISSRKLHEGSTLLLIRASRGSRGFLKYSEGCYLAHFYRRRENKKKRAILRPGQRYDGKKRHGKEHKRGGRIRVTDQSAIADKSRNEGKKVNPILLSRIGSGTRSKKNGTVGISGKRFQKDDSGGLTGDAMRVRGRRPSEKAGFKTGPLKRIEILKGRWVNPKDRVLFKLTESKLQIKHS